MPTIFLPLYYGKFNVFWALPVGFSHLILLLYDFPYFFYFLCFHWLLFLICHANTRFLSFAFLNDGEVLTELSVAMLTVFLQD